MRALPQRGDDMHGLVMAWLVLGCVPRSANMLEPPPTPGTHVEEGSIKTLSHQGGQGDQFVTSWFNEREIFDASENDEAPALWLHRRDATHWSDVSGESTVTVDGSVVRVELRCITGEVTSQADEESLHVAGTWDGKALDIRVTPEVFEVTWGRVHSVFQRVEPERPGCRLYQMQSQGGFHFTEVSDARHVCGRVLGTRALSVEAAVLLLRTTLSLDRPVVWNLRALLPGVRSFGDPRFPHRPMP
jgi:hypothetical protein